MNLKNRIIYITIIMVLLCNCNNYKSDQSIIIPGEWGPQEEDFPTFYNWHSNSSNFVSFEYMNVKGLHLDSIVNLWGNYEHVWIDTLYYGLGKDGYTNCEFAGIFSKVPFVILHHYLWRDKYNKSITKELLFNATLGVDTPFWGIQVNVDSVMMS